MPPEIIYMLLGAVLTIATQWVTQGLQAKRERAKYRLRTKEQHYIELGNFLMEYYAHRDVFFGKNSIDNDFLLKINSFKTKNELYASENVKHEFINLLGYIVDNGNSEKEINERIGLFFTLIKSELKD